MAGIRLHQAYLAVSKLCAARAQDLAFVRILIDQGLVKRGEIEAATRNLPDGQRSIVEISLGRL